MKVDNVQNSPGGNSCEGGGPTKKDIAAARGCGCLVATGMAYWMIAIGIILCFTGIGALIGVPLIIAGILMPIFGWGMGKEMASCKMIAKDCPYCGRPKVVAQQGDISNGGITCPACQHRIIIRDGEFGRLDD